MHFLTTIRVESVWRHDGVEDRMFELLQGAAAQVRCSSNQKLRTVFSSPSSPHLPEQNDPTTRSDRNAHRSVLATDRTVVVDGMHELPDPQKAFWHMLRSSLLLDRASTYYRLALLEYALWVGS